MKVYLDDIRQPHSEGWRVVRTPKEVIELLKTGEVEGLSLDHDLGADDTLGTGYDVLLWLEQEVALNAFKPPKDINVHSANPAARIKMELTVKKIHELWEQQQQRR